MEGMHVLLFVEFTKDHTKTSMVVKKISKELVEQDHDVTVLGGNFEKHNIYLI